MSEERKEGEEEKAPEECLVCRKWELRAGTERRESPRFPGVPHHPECVFLK